MISNENKNEIKKIFYKLLKQKIQNTNNVKKKKAKPFIKTNSNPLAHTDIIWYSDDLDTGELERKFSQKYKIKTLKDFENNNTTNTNNTNISHQKIIPNEFIDQCIKVDNNIFQLVDKDGENIFLDWLIFIKDGKKYYPEKFTISIQNKIKKTIYRELIEKPNNYKFANIPFPIKFDSNFIFDVKIVIEDSEQVEQVLLGLKHNINNLQNSYYIDSHKLLYNGKKSELKFSDCDFMDLIIIGENIFNITIIKDNYPILKNIPIQLLEIKPNTYSCKSIFENFNQSDNSPNNILFNTQSELEIILDKNPNSSIKIYGFKYKKLINK